MNEKQLFLVYYLNVKQIWESINYVTLFFPTAELQGQNETEKAENGE